MKIKGTCQSLLGGVIMISSTGCNPYGGLRPALSLSVRMLAGHSRSKTGWNKWQIFKKYSGITFQLMGNGIIWS
mgnify:CR=1 FL=1